MLDESKLAIHQATTFEKWSFDEAVEGYARHGVQAMGVWRDKLQEFGVQRGARLLRETGMTVSDYSPAGLLTPLEDLSFQQRLDDNRRIIDEAAEIGAQCVVLISGGLDDDSRDIERARGQAKEGLAALIPHAKAAGVAIGLEPLHPMLCASRSVLTSLEMTNDWCDELADDDTLGVVIDVYHVWWEPHLARDIARAACRIRALHVCDWLQDTRDLRLDRGMMGDGVIDIPAIRRMVEAAGYTGFREVEVFSERDWWRRDPDEVVQIVKQRYQSFV